MLRRKEDGSVCNSYCQVRKLDRKLDVEAERIVSFFFFSEYRGNYFWILILYNYEWVAILAVFPPTLLLASF